MESEKTVKQPMGRPRKRLLESNGRVYRRKPTRTIDEPADGEETTSVKSAFDTSIPWRKSSALTLSLHCLYGTLQSSSHWKDVWRLQKNIQHDFADMISSHYAQQLPLILTASHWQLRIATSDMLLFPFQRMYVLSAAPIKALFDCHIIWSAFRCWNYFRGAHAILETIR